MDAAVRAAHNQPREDDRPLRVERAVGDPELLRERARRVEDKLLGRGVVDSRRPHLYRVVAVAELRQGEAADVREGVDACCFGGRWWGGVGLGFRFRALVLGGVRMQV